MKIQYEPKIRKSYEKKNQLKLNDKVQEKDFTRRSNSRKTNNSTTGLSNKEIRFMKNNNESKKTFGNFYHKYFNISNSQKQKTLLSTKQKPFFVSSEMIPQNHLNQKRRSLADLKSHYSQSNQRFKIVRNSFNKPSNPSKNYDSLNGKMYVYS